eukprot:TRINITY_DN4277_c0_g1_i4.p1 TRINITY_DN4277_c0_g1~~TRINITY_DN4277_c0_g1_i4.p1  ORF type:complete len:442 (+),score=89.44 TRINITY_DN4277_c0_g1_i4:123-1328(+)
MIETRDALLECLKMQGQRWIARGAQPARRGTRPSELFAVKIICRRGQLTTCKTEERQLDTPKDVRIHRPADESQTCPAVIWLQKAASGHICVESVVTLHHNTCGSAILMLASPDEPPSGTLLPPECPSAAQAPDPMFPPQSDFATRLLHALGLMENPTTRSRPVNFCAIFFFLTTMKELEKVCREAPVPANIRDDVSLTLDLLRDRAVVRLFLSNGESAIVCPGTPEVPDTGEIVGVEIVLLDELRLFSVYPENVFCDWTPVKNDWGLPPLRLLGRDAIGRQFFFAVTFGTECFERLVSLLELVQQAAKIATISQNTDFLTRVHMIMTDHTALHTLRHSPRHTQPSIRKRNHNRADTSNTKFFREKQYILGEKTPPARPFFCVSVALQRQSQRFFESFARP